MDILTHPGVLCFTGAITLQHLLAARANQQPPHPTTLKPWPELAQLNPPPPIPPEMQVTKPCPHRLLAQLHSLQHKHKSLYALQLARKSVTPSCQSISYSNTAPLIIMSGSNCYLTSYETTSSSSTIQSTVYLDTRNNVPCCGHSNPTIVSAIHSQASLINTNTRYLHPDFVELKLKLIKTLPSLINDDWLIILTNSGSESNDLALRIASSNSKNSDITLTTDMGYHGHTEALINVSPYKLKSIGINEPLEGTKWLKHPNSYTHDTQYYIKDIDLNLKNTIEPVLIYEIGMSVGGVILPPPGYLPHLVNSVKTKKGTVIFDCVQTACGRLGIGKWWGFEGEGVIPDIVTVGKPLGNGHPISACCVRKSVVKNFDDMGMEYFNTFGGNTVSVAAGLATVNEIERMDLQSNCSKVGSILIKGFRKFMVLHPNTIGDVRGEGLFIGVEILSSYKDKNPGTFETSWICSKMKDDYRVLTTIDGENDNVIVVKPPQTFGEVEVEYFLWAFGMVVKELERAKRYRNFEIGEKTPT